LCNDNPQLPYDYSDKNGENETTIIYHFIGESKPIVYHFEINVGQHLPSYNLNSNKHHIPNAK
jgi:hypothetical protein